MEPLSIVRLHHVTVELWPDHVRSVFRDGAEVTAAPNEGETLLDTVVHEFLHHAYAEALSDEPSHCLRAVADGDARRWTPERTHEEGIAYSMSDRVVSLFRSAREAGYL